MKLQTCTPCVFNGFTGISKPVTISIAEVEKMAFDTISIIYDDYLSNNHNVAYRHYYYDMLEQGTECFRIKTRFRPVVTGRYLMFNYLLRMGYTAPQIAERYNVDRTTVLHGRESVKAMIEMKSDNDIKSAYLLFLSMIMDYKK